MFRSMSNSKSDVLAINLTNMSLVEAAILGQVLTTTDKNKILTEFDLLPIDKAIIDSLSPNEPYSFINLNAELRYRECQTGVNTLHFDVYEKDALGKGIHSIVKKIIGTVSVDSCGIANYKAKNYIGKIETSVSRHKDVVSQFEERMRLEFLLSKQAGFLRIKPPLFNSGTSVMVMKFLQGVTVENFKKNDVIVPAATPNPVIPQITVLVPESTPNQNTAITNPNTVTAQNPAPPQNAASTQITKTNQTKVSAQKRLQACASAARNLEIIHKRKVLHRDIKPANAIVDFSNDAAEATLIDFGLGRNLNDPEDHKKMGTPLYAAYEYFCKNDPGQKIFYDLTIPSDIYSFSWVLIFLLRGKDNPSRTEEEAIALAQNCIPQELCKDLTDLDSGCQQQLHDLIKSMQNVTPEKRGNMTNIVRDLEDIQLGHNLSLLDVRETKEFAFANLSARTFRKEMDEIMEKNPLISFSGMDRLLDLIEKQLKAIKLESQFATREFIKRTYVVAWQNQVTLNDVLIFTKNIFAGCKETFLALRNLYTEVDNLHTRYLNGSIPNKSEKISATLCHLVKYLGVTLALPQTYLTVDDIVRIQTKMQKRLQAYQARFDRLKSEMDFNKSDMSESSSSYESESESSDSDYEDASAETEDEAEELSIPDITKQLNSFAACWESSIEQNQAFDGLSFFKNASKFIPFKKLSSQNDTHDSACRKSSLSNS